MFRSLLFFAFALPSAATAAELEPRFRIAAMGGAGAFSRGPMVSFDSAIQAGAQLTPRFGVVGELGTAGGFAFGLTLNSNEVQQRVSGVGHRYFAPMAELDLGSFFVAAGPTLGWSGWGGITQGVVVTENGEEVQQYAYAVTADPALSGQARVGFQTGKLNANGQRHGVLIAATVRVLHGKVFEAGQTASPDGVSQGFRVGDRIWGFLPTLNVGYGFR